MSDNNNEILIRALEASGSDREAKLARAILGNAPAQEQTPAQQAVQAPAAGVPDSAALPPEIAALAATLPTPPPGKAQLESLDAWEALPQEERQERLNEAEALMKAGHK